MGRLYFLPTTLKARLALAGTLTIIYIVASTLYIRYGSSAFPLLQTKPDDTQHVLLPTQNATTNGKAAPSTPEQPRILLVSAFFPLPTSKISQADYDMWLRNYLQSVTTDVYLYTTPEQAARVQAFRDGSLNLTVDANFTSIFDIPPLKGKEDAYTKIRKKDRERPRHSIESYAVLNAKPYFLHSAVTNLAARGVNYDYAFSNDATSFHKEHHYRKWPSPSRVDQIWDEGSKLSGTKKEDLLFVPMWAMPHNTMAFWQESMGPIDSKFSEGSFFGGSPTAIDWWARTFYTYHDSYLSFEIFIGKDQSLINALFLLFPSRFITVWYNDPDAPTHVALNRTNPEESFLGQCDSEWFYYQLWLADAQTQDAMREQWIQSAQKWRLWGWWNPRDTTRCQDTRVLSMTEVLKRRLGEGWNPPGRSVNVPQSIKWTISQ
ncbi:hypothetical protein BDZ97DRAFT_1667478 [Flammula alnicola]|nr:hypothetical protein BDZ97DRAFT_1667478 [Flammula alnicola]